MKEIIENKLEQLNKEYDEWLERYDKEGLEYQEDIIHQINCKIRVLNEVLREYNEIINADLLEKVGEIDD
jgi:vacuolar-type H+-ATPase subunit H